MRSRKETDKGTVYVIDDDVNVRNGLARLLRSAGRNVESFPAAQDFLDNVAGDGIGCILLDVSMPGMSGPELHDQLRARGGNLPVVYLTGHGTVSIGVQAMRQGAFDFLEKPVDEAALLSVVKAAIAHREHASVEEARLIEIRGRISQLSPREREVMDHVIKGRLNKQIAGDLGIGVKTVKVHRGRVMQKMAVRSVAQLVHLCDALGVGRPDTPS
ncbi:MAG: response regulator [Mizugakiibacter sp.]|uniref:response regulator transcription factor n=1 Tax=Mizugakiibacter sp. TaxID=1972610 RepID=UPI0031C025BD|nr:response regulator [Xanthomonadaceae bacterium]